MTCREFIERLLDYHAGELPPDAVALFREHFAECPPCLAYLDSYERTVKLCRGCAEASLPEVPEDLIRAILLVRTASRST